jgi:hypothetical protein
MMTERPKTRRVQVAAHTREMPLKTYQLQCAWCCKDATVECYPGRPPRFCSDACADEARKAHDRARKAAGQPPAPEITSDGRRRRGRPQKYPPLTRSVASGAAEPAWGYLAPDLPLSPRDAAGRAVQARSTLRAQHEVLLAMTQVNKTTALAVLDDLRDALVVWRSALVRRTLLEELVRSSGPPVETHLVATLELALATVRDPAWPTAIAELRELVAREGRIRRQGDQLQLRKLVATIADELSRAQGGSELAFVQVLARPQLWAPAATWLERGMGQLVAVRSSDHTREDSHAYPV